MRGVAVLAGLLVAMTAGAAAQDQCALQDTGTGSVRAVLDGRTFVLTDGREVRLAALEFSDTADASRAALGRLLGGRDVTLRRLGEDKDRHGRLLAYVFTAGSDRSIQQELVAAGLARVAGRVGDMSCARELLAAEHSARTAGLGLWSDRAYAPRGTDDLAGLLGERGRFTLVEGRVISVRESGGTIYVNFGRRWSEDFTATLLKRNEKVFAAAGIDLKKLAGRDVRLRGVIEERGGPWIELVRPEQIEFTGRH